MKAAVIHIDSEMTWRGGQQQAVYLFEAMHSRAEKTVFFTKRNSELAKYLKNKNLPCYELAMKGEFDIFSAYHIYKFAKSNGFNILHCHSSHSLSIGLLASLFSNDLKVIATRRVDFHINKNLFSKIKYQHKNIAKIVCISDAINNILLNDGIDENRLKVIKSGIDLSKFNNSRADEIRKSLDIPEKKIAIGTIAAFEGHKDYDNFIDAAKIVVEYEPYVIFIAVGDGSLFDLMKEKVVKYGIEDNVHFVGYKKNVGDYLKCFDIFVLSSKKEGLGTSILDAMSVGLPIVATNVGGIPEAVINGENGIIVERKTPELLAKAIIKLLKEPNLRAEYGKKSLELVKNFDINITIARNIELYQEILENE